MGLISEEVEINLYGRNIKWYKDKGYDEQINNLKREDNQKRMSIPKGTKIKVKVEDLPNGSEVKVEIQCDKCKIKKYIQWCNYLKLKHEEGEYYCRGCAVALFGAEKMRLTKLNNSNSISITNPELIKFFYSPGESKLYSSHSTYKIKAICPNCRYIKTISLDNLTDHGFGCPKCSDGISYPEKFMFNFLEQLLENNFEKQKKFKWSQNKIYDFYIPTLNIIIETHGLQHYKQINSKNYKILLEEQKNDTYKKQLALINGIPENNYIILDCRESNLEWIKNSILTSNLLIFLNSKEENINWEECDKYATKTKVKEVCDLWNKGITNTTKIINITKLGKSTVINYLKRGEKLGWCNYNPKDEMRKNGANASGHFKGKPIYCITTNEYFSSGVKAEKKYNISNSSIFQCCKEKRKSAGKHPKTGEKLKWKYATEEEINKFCLDKGD